MTPFQVSWVRSIRNDQPPKIQKAFGSSLINAQDRDPVVEWRKEGLVDLRSYRPEFSAGTHYIAYFNTEENAVLFKLKWL
jgi:hypothetical protein